MVKWYDETNQSLSGELGDRCDREASKGDRRKIGALALSGRYYGAGQLGRRISDLNDVI